MATRVDGSISPGDTVLSGTVTRNGTLTASLSQNGRTIGGSVAPGSSGTGTSDYERLRNKPQIESVELIGNKSFEELGLEPIASDELIDILY